jgi:hypothetical protein
MANLGKVSICIVPLAFLFGCQPVETADAIPPTFFGSATNTADYFATEKFSRTTTYTETATHFGATETPVPTVGLLGTSTPSPTEYPTPWPEGFTPTVRPTPTRGLPPTVTKAFTSSCPNPTQAAISVVRMDDPADYERSLLDQIAARGELDSFLIELAAMADPFDSSTRIETVLFVEDVNNDTTKEFIVSIRQPFENKSGLYGPVGSPYRTVVFIFGCRERQYVTLYTLVLDRNEIDLPSGLLAVEDLNGNGIREVVVSTVEGVGNRLLQNLSARVLEWDGTVFRDVLIPDLQDPFTARTVDSVVEFQDVDGNGTREILFPRKYWMDGAGVDCDAGPDRNYTAVWMWDGDAYHFMWRIFADPSYRFQAAYDGDYYAYLGLSDLAETSYLRGAFDESLKPGSTRDWARDGKCRDFEKVKPDPTEPIKIRAYARFRLVELFVHVGRVMEAESHRTDLRINYPLGSPGYIYAYLANIFWWEYVKDEDVTAACGKVRQEAEKFQPDVFNLFENYGVNNPGPNLDNICPFSSETDT